MVRRCLTTLVIVLGAIVGSAGAGPSCTSSACEGTRTECDGDEVRACVVDWCEMRGTVDERCTSSRHWDSSACDPGYGCLAVGSDVGCVRRGTRVCAAEKTLHPYGGRWLVGDLDGDGREDLVIIGDSEVVSFMTGGKTVKTFATRLPGHTSLVDNDGDGKLDLVWLSQDAIRTAHGDGAGAFAIDSPPAANTEVNVLKFSDVDLDGKLDAIVEEQHGQESNLLVLFTTDGGSRRGPTTPTYGIIYAIVDFDGDHILDVLYLDAILRHDAMLLGKRDGSFTLRTTLASPGGESPVLIDPRAVDIDGDGDVDLVIPPTGGDALLMTWWNDGTGLFTRPPECSTHPTASRCSFGLDAGGFHTARLLDVVDVNADGRPDLIATPDSTPSTLWIAHGEGDGSFAPWNSILIPSSVRSVRAIDERVLLETTVDASNRGVYALPKSCL